MNFTKEDFNPHPREHMNAFKAVFFSYTFSTFKKGFKKTLDVTDLYNPLNNDRSSLLGDRLERIWSSQSNKSRKLNSHPSLLTALLHAFWLEYLLLGCFLAFTDLFVRLVQPIMLGGLLDYFKPDSTVTKEEAYWYAAAMVSLSVANTFLMNQYVLRASHYGMRARTAVCSLIYRKALRLSRTALGETASGKVVNLLSNDVSRFDMVSIVLHHMWLSPLMALIIMVILYKRAGYAAFIGMLPICFIVALQSYTGKLSARYRKRTAFKTDERIRLMDEIICGIQVIKMYAWEKPFSILISHVRKLEMNIIVKASYVRALFMTFNLFTTRAAMFCTLVTLALSGEQITASKTFVFMSYYNTIAMTLTRIFIRGVSELAEFLVAVKRLEGFLLNEEFSESHKITEKNDTVNENDLALVFDKVTAKWNINSAVNALCGISVKVPKGCLLGVIGPVGSGKSSFLQTVLGELEITEGTITLKGSISYASQDPWVFAATIRQNILFGEEYDKERYNETIKVCALEKDVKQFSKGDLTLIGERGASLSGGQKARINLARAIYRDADVYLLDDPLSAVDIHVGKHLFEECIMRYLKRKTVILVTHQVYHLKKADHVVILNRGSVEAEGTFEEVSKMKEIEYAKLLTQESEKQQNAEMERIKRQTSRISRNESIASSLSEISLMESITEVMNDEPEEQEIKTKDIQEESSKGKVKGSLFLKYIKSNGRTYPVVIVTLLFALSQTIASGVDYFVSFWANIEEFRGINSTSTNVQKIPDWSTDLCIYVYTGLLVSLFLVALYRSLLFFTIAKWCSQRLHDSMFSNIIRATMRFFETNPSGRILNRFSKDIGGIDELLPRAIMDASQLVQMVGALVLVTTINPYFLFLVGFLSILVYLLRIVFLRTSKDLKRLQGITRSPAFTHLNATLHGLTTIRAYGAQENLEKEFDNHQDLHTSAWFMFITASSAFGFYVDILCLVFIGFVTFSFLCLSDVLGFAGGEVGLAISQAMMLTGMVQFGMKQTAEVANQMMSVERVLEYECLPREEEPERPIAVSDWPSAGRIKFNQVGLRYAEELPLVLENLNFEINPKEKVGIVGRTGAGKSSLIAAIFRLAKVEGVIQIDGFDTKAIELQTLRKKISIIPQDPVLFSGTLRYNLDPFEEYPDELLWKALEEVELKDDANHKNRLESRVMDRGTNYSVGERQLICLARAIVRDNKILVLDEATANVDPQTDVVIQKTIRSKFADCTVLTIAHRLNTIMDCDRVLVMDAGTVAEFEHPYLLLLDQASMFSKMVAEVGRLEALELKNAAKKNFESRT